MTTRRPLVLAALLLTVVACAPASQSTAGPDASGQPGTSLGWYDELTGGTDKLDVATTVAPISSLARNIGGDRIRLRGLVPDATNSHTFEPAPSDSRYLQAADLIIVNGLHLEQPTLDLAEASKRPEAPIKMLGDNTITPEEWLFDFSFPESEGDPNPHLWMNVPYAERYAELMRDWFSEADPANADYYAANFEKVKARLDELDSLIRQGVETVPPDEPQAAHLPRLVGLLGTRVRLRCHRCRPVVGLLRPEPAGGRPIDRPDPRGTCAGGLRIGGLPEPGARADRPGIGRAIRR